MKRFLLISATIILAHNLLAQDVIYPDNYTPGSYSYNQELNPRMNFLKTNLTSITIRNFSLQYERVLTKRLSVALSYRNMPAGSTPFKNTLISLSDNDPDVEDMFNTLSMQNYAITPEIRMYVGKRGFGRGFYIAPFYRYADYRIKNMSFEYSDETPGSTGTITLSGSTTAGTFGLMLGAQWPLGRSFVLDWWIVGPHYGNSKGELAGTTSTPMSPDAQSQVREALENIEIPLVQTAVEVSANRAAISFDGPWAGFRAGISFGIRF